MTAKQPQSCGECRWAEGWLLTRRGKVRKDDTATCEHPQPRPFVMSTRMIIYVSPHDGESCPCFEKVKSDG